MKKKTTKAAAKKKTTKKPKKAGLAAELEESASEQEPMGSIAAAVPGSDKLAQDAINSKKRPGAEATEIRDEPETTAGTEAKIESEEIVPGDKA